MVIPVVLIILGWLTFCAILLWPLFKAATQSKGHQVPRTYYDDYEREEERLKAWDAEFKRRRAEHLAKLDAETKTLAEGVLERVRTRQRLGLYEKLAISKEEFEAYEAWLLPQQRFMDVKLTESGVPNLLCKRVPLYVEDES